MSAFPAARRSAWRSCRWRCWQPRLAVLDETDSGLDIDALRIVAEGVNALRARTLVPRHHALPAPARLYQARRRACHGQGPDREIGGPELALELERNGYRDYATRRRESP